MSDNNERPSGNIPGESANSNRAKRRDASLFNLRFSSTKIELRAGVDDSTELSVMVDRERKRRGNISTSDR